VELVTVMVIVAALAVVAMPRLPVRGYAGYHTQQELLTALRYAQKTAVASGCPLEVEIDATADTYRVQFWNEGDTDSACGSSGAPLVQPAGAGTLDNRAVEGDIQTGGHILIDRFGCPKAVNDFAQHEQLSVALHDGRQIIMEAHTGYIHD